MTFLRYPSPRYFSQCSRRFSTPIKVAIVGTGPGGFYTAHHLLNKSSADKVIHIDFFEKLPTPFGLSRYGVAPDHPEVKNCEEFLTNLMKHFKLSSSSASASALKQEQRHKVRFLGNVEVGKDLKLANLEKYYNSIVLAYGSTSSDNKLSIPGSNLPGVIPARQFVNWYNGHPDCYKKGEEYIPPALEKIEDVTIIGNGNVAIDVARILLADPKRHWAQTDIAVDAEKLLEQSKVKNVRIVARRGILESAFSNKELRELLELKDAKFLPLSQPELLQVLATKKLDRVAKRRLSLLEKYNNTLETTSNKDKRTWSLEYLQSPVEFLAADNGKLEATKFVKNKAIDDPLLPGQIAPTDEHVVVKNELVILSIGYQGTPIGGFEELGIWFDKNKLHNKGGRVLLKKSAGENDANLTYKKGWYTSGWIKNGPKGAIATTMMDSFDTAENILKDLTNGNYIQVDDGQDILESDELPKEKEIVYWSNWEKLNEYELEKGKELGKQRYKVCNKQDMLNVCKA
ncbi:ARH1 [Candida oxycetoniae]|uniref:NADPH:adrenodoxin oxidoreductase, mitochondrial n=1 Tax=Candida oxycetoniae TaxID=497107 RepID=A0AAI9WWG3_9ASCO|nr:ARH1 [Candida oxycetoniae]KAI3403190.2 ARH1 [Candida oxycetoniae]